MGTAKIETTLPAANGGCNSPISADDFYVSIGSKARTVRELIDLAAEARPESWYLISPETKQALTFKSLQEGARLNSARLREAGLKHGDKVAFLFDNGLFAAQLFLGAMYGGLVSVPLNVNAGASQLAYMIDHCDATVIFVAQEYAALLSDVMQQVQRSVKVIPSDLWATSDTTDTTLPASLPAGPEPEDEALLMYSSGSTGRPKGAVHSHRALLAAARNSVSSHELTSADRSLLVLPLYHINAECVTLMPTLISGGSVVIPHRFSVSRFWDWLDEYRCTWSAVVPTIISQLLDWKDPNAGNRADLFNRLRFLRSSSAPLAPSLHREFMEKFKILLIQAMGSSEAGNIFSNPLPPRENKIGSPGLPWGFEAKIVNRDGAELASNDPGEVLLRGPAMMEGYYKEPEATAAVLDADGWFHTGDLAYRDAHGYFFVVGRSKELIIKGGVNIAPRQIDDVLEAHPAVLEAAAIGVPDHHLGEDIVAYVVLRAGAKVDETELLSYCEGRLGHFKTPTRIHFANDLPKGPSGKVQRLRLLEEGSHFSVARGSGSEFAKADRDTTIAQNELSAATAIKRIITDCWIEVLGTSNFDAESNFFALGGHSLLAVQCLSRLREKAFVLLSLSDFFDNGTVAKQTALVIGRLRLNSRSEGQSLTEVLERNLQPQIECADTLSPIPLRDRTTPCPLSPGQRRLWFTELLSEGVPLYNESEAVRLVGKLDTSALESAFQTIVSRHELLRTTIHVHNEEPFALVNEDWRPHVKMIDLSALSPLTREEEVSRLLVEEPQRPFNLQSEPGIRLTVLRLSRQEHVLILLMHHIVCDWASEGIFWRELASAYRSFCRDEPVAVPPLPIQFGDYAAWKIQETEQTHYEEDLTYWEDNLRGAPEVLDLPADRPRPAVLSNRGARLRIKLDPTLTRALRELSQRTETTLFTIFVAALNVLLYRYSGKEDILLGVPIANRDRKELQDLIGFLLHVQVLRTRLSDEMSFRELLGYLQKQALALYEHRAVPFEQVVDRIRPKRSLSYSPLFQTMFVWRDREQSLPFIGLEGLKVESLLAESKTSKFDLTLFATDCGDEVWLEMEYSTDLFNTERIERLLGHFQVLLQGVIADPSRRLSELPLLTSEERHRMLVEWNDTQVDYPENGLLHKLFEAQVERTPHAVAVEFDGERLSYLELNQRANQLAHYLRRLGVRADSLVGVCMERSLELVVALYGTLKAGGAYVPIDPGYPQERVIFMLQDADVPVLLTQERLAGDIPKHHGKVVSLDRDWKGITCESSDNPVTEVTPDNLAYMIYTSGSTGKPKGAMNTHRGICNRLLWGQDRYGLKESDKVLQKTPFSFDVSAWELFWPLITGAHLIVVEPRAHLDPAYLLRLIAEQEITVAHFVPSMLRIFLEQPGVERCRSLRDVMCSGEALPYDLQEKFFGLLSARLHNLYGPTEAAVEVTHWTCRRNDERKIVPIGRPVANTQVYVLDRSLQPVPIGVPGELYIGGVQVARGYHKRAELTEDKFIRDPYSGNPESRLYKTGDLCRWLPDGVIEYLGRTDFQVKIRGFRIELGEIESALKQHSNIRECVLVAHAEASDTRLVAYVTLAEPHIPPTTPTLRAFLKETLPEYMIPAAFVVLQVLPLTPNGKIDRNTLVSRRYEGAERSLEQPSAAPSTTRELLVLQIWQRILGVQEIGVRDSFFDLGGHSLLIVRMLGEVNKSLNVSLSLPTLFLNPTVEGIARAVDQNIQQGPKLIPLQAARSDGTMFFLDASLAMCRLAQLLDGPASFATAVPVPCEVLEAAVNKRAADLPSLEDIAAPHVALIRSLKPSSPCVLVGHSFGGLLAFEVAHQLQRDGIQVDMVIVGDTTVNWSMAWGDRLKRLDYRRALWSLKWRAEHVSLMTANAAKRLFSRSRHQPEPVSLSLQELNQQFANLPWETRREISSKAARSYRCRPLEARGVLIRARDEPRYTYLPDMGWGGLFTGGLEILDTSGTHLSLLQSPFILDLSCALGECLARLRSLKQSCSRPAASQ